MQVHHHHIYISCRSEVAMSLWWWRCCWCWFWRWWPSWLHEDDDDDDEAMTLLTHRKGCDDASESVAGRHGCFTHVSSHSQFRLGRTRSGKRPARRPCGALWWAQGLGFRVEIGGHGLCGTDPSKPRPLVSESHAYDNSNSNTIVTWVRFKTPFVQAVFWVDPRSSNSLGLWGRPQLHT